MTRYKPTLDDYVVMGRMFKDANRALSKLHIFVSQKIGKTKADRICDFWAFDKKFQRLRSELEEMMFRDYPELANTDVFYGPTEDDR